MTNKINGNGLALIANKVAARIFDISSGMIHASIRDQIVRAQLLIRDLANFDPECKKILIVGAGVGGITAATTASHLGIEAIVVDTKSRPLDVQANVKTRFVGPFIYEWPDVVHSSQSYPLSIYHSNLLEGTPTWDSDMPLSAACFAKKFTEWLETKPFGDKIPRFIYEVNGKEVIDFVNAHKEWAEENHNLSLKNLPPKVKLEMNFEFKLSNESGPDYIILAAGMGVENVKLSDGVMGLPFWKDDDLKKSAVDDMTVGIFGGGDGALQDVLRLCTRFNHPLELIDHINEDNDAKQALSNILPLLQSMEHQSRLLSSWSTGSTSALIDANCRDIASKLAENDKVCAQLNSGLRSGKGKVLHIVREEYFGKAYLLNRFCVHLLDHYMQKSFKSSDSYCYELHFLVSDFEVLKEVVDGEVTYNLKFNTDSGELNIPLNRIVVRFGVEGSSAPGQQMIKMDKSTNDRTSMAGVPLPFSLIKG